MSDWTRFHLRVDTPLFSGDTPEPDTDTAATDRIVRVPSVRGALRFWYRAVAAGYGGQDLNTLARGEAEVFGSTRARSPVRLRITELHGKPQRGKPEWASSSEEGFSGARYLLGQGLWGRELRRPYLSVDSTFTLCVRFDGDERTTQRFMLALWAWITYGGLGARVRRGFGRLSVDGIDNPPWDWTTEMLSPVADARAESDRRQTAYPAEITRPLSAAFPDAGERPGGRDLPEFPTLSDDTWAGRTVDGTPTPRSLGKTLHRLGEVWRLFRNGDAHPGTPTPEWEETILGSSEEYPIAALGLPVNYFNPGTGIGSTVNLELHGQPARRASMVWLMPVRLPGKDNYLAYSHAFRTRFAPDNAEITHRTTKKGGKAKHRNDSDVSVLRRPDRGTIDETWAAWREDGARPEPHGGE